METDVFNLSHNFSETNGETPSGSHEIGDVPKSVIYTLYGLCIFMIVTGNVMVIMAVFLEPKLRQSPTNLLIVSLAVSDLLVGCYYIPAVIMWDEATHLMANAVICNIDGFLGLTSTGASVFTLIAIAVDRFRAIVTPFKPKITRGQAGIMIAIAWVCAMCYALYLPVIFEWHTDVITIGNQTFSQSYCFIKLQYIPKWKYFRLADCIMLFIVPLVILLCLYAPMIYKLWFDKQPVSSTGRKKKRAVKMLSMVMVIFFTMWLPYYALYLYANYGDIFNSTLNIRAWALVNQCLNFSNSWINPIIYGCFNDNFRKAYKNALLCRLWTSSHRIYPTTFHESEMTNATRNEGQTSRPTRNTLLTTANTASMKGSQPLQVSHALPNVVIPKDEAVDT